MAAEQSRAASTVHETAKMSAEQDVTVSKVDETKKMAVDQSPTSFGLDLGVDTVNIIVGEEPGTPFKLHLNLLIAKVPYFEKMFRGGFREAEERKAHLPEDAAVVFGLFVEWLYRERLPAIRRAHGDTPFNDCIDLYCFAEKICQEDLMDITITHIIKYLDNSSCEINTAEMLHIYQNTPPSSQLRKFAACSFVYSFSEGNSDLWSTKELSAAMNKKLDLCEDVMAILRKNLGTTPVLDPRENPCNFHLHKKEIFCPYKKVH